MDTDSINQFTGDENLDSVINWLLDYNQLELTNH